MKIKPSFLEKTSVGQLLGVVLLGFFIITACKPSPNCARPDVLCVGLVTNTSGLQDGGLNQSAWQSLQRAQQEGLIQYAAYIEANDPRDYDRNIAYFVRRGYDVIITSGSTLNDETLHFADDDPATVFIGLDQPPQSEHANLTTVQFPADQMGFLAGALAAQMTQTGILAAICETKQILANWQTCQGFKAGAAYSQRPVKVLLAYHDNARRETLFADPQWGQTTAQNFIAQGADVLFASGGGTGQGALLAAAQAGVAAIGSEQDQFYVTPEASAVLLTSVVKNADPIVYAFLQQIHHHQPLPPTAIGQITLAPDHGRASLIPESVQHQITELQQALSSGTLQTGVPARPPQ